jgi:CDP-6-deoxy-D-xylo-4-hexulose-3-dehydrase
MKYSLVSDTIRDTDIDALSDWLKTYPRLSKGELTPQFEELWARWLGTKHAVYVNSGSSANLIILSALVESGVLALGDEVIVPALSWATDLAPVIQLGLKPLLCDCNLKDLSLNLDHFEKLCTENNPRALMFVSVLGLVPEMDRVVFMCEKYNVTLVEDTCESFGSEFNGRKLGTFGAASTFSLYFGHHLSTIEGGIVATNDTRLYNILLSIRSHGWARDCDPEFAQALRDKWQTNPFSDQYTFYYAGYNLRSTDLQAFLGLRQMTYADDVVRQRVANYHSYVGALKDGLWKPTVGDKHLVSNFCYPILSKNRSDVKEHLAANGIETRPLICGSMARQPVYVARYGEADCPNAERIHDEGLYLPNNHRLTSGDIKNIAGAVNEIAL